MTERDDEHLKHWGIPGMKWKNHKKKDDPEKEKVMSDFKSSIKNLIKTIKAAKKKSSAVVKKAKKVKKKVVKKVKKTEKKLVKKKDHAKKKLKDLLKKHGSKKTKDKGKKGGSGKKSKKGGSGKKSSSGSKDSVVINKGLKGETTEQLIDKKLRDLFSDHDARGRVISKSSKKIAGLRSSIGKSKDERLKELSKAAKTKTKKHKSKK
jgi:hypothetical protein